MKNSATVATFSVSHEGVAILENKRTKELELAGPTDVIAREN